MLEKCKSLGVESRIQREAVFLLCNSQRGFMRSDFFRERLIYSLANGGYSAASISKINSEVEAMVEQRLFIRQVKKAQHEIGLNRTVWKIQPEIICLIHDATKIVSCGKLFEGKFCELVLDVKKQLRKMGGTRRQVSNTALEILIVRFRST